VIHDLTNYLFAASRRRVLNHVRSKSVREKYADYYRSFSEFEETVTEKAVHYEELTNEVEKVLRRLPEKTQQVFRLNRLEGYSIDEISDYLKLPKRTIGYHLTKSLKEFRVYLKDFILLLFLFIKL
jgi:RNA polymerase sigma-70 factor (ECF subfamily)